MLAFIDKGIPGVKSALDMLIAAVVVAIICYLFVIYLLFVIDGEACALKPFLYVH